jgi:DNA-binding MarR family transcriptional regulator
MSELKLLFSDLIRFETRLWNLVDARLRAECDLQLTWFEPMQVMSSSGACRVYDIAEELSITVGGTSKLVDCIEAAGLCRRRSNPQDRRSSIIELTPAGRRLLARADAVFEDELQRRLGSSISAAALVRLGSTLRDLRSAINQPPDRAVGGPHVIVAPAPYPTTRGASQ